VVYLALVRIAVGLTFLSHLVGQLLGLGGQPSWVFQSPLGSMVQQAMASPAMLAFYANFLRRVVEPNLAVFNYLVLLGELGIGIALTFGVFTRLGAVAALLFTAGVILLKTLPSSGADIDHVFFVCELAILLGGAGRALGVDGLLFAPRMPEDAPAPAANRTARAS